MKSEKDESFLLSCIPPGCVSTRTARGVEALSFSYNNGLSHGPVLHVKAEAVIKLEDIKLRAQELNLKMVQSKNEWLIYKPK